MENERYPTQKKQWVCPKCDSSTFTEDVVTMTGKSFSRFMNIQNRKFSAITCNNVHLQSFTKVNLKVGKALLTF